MCQYSSRSAVKYISRKKSKSIQETRQKEIYDGTCIGNEEVLIYFFIVLLLTSHRYDHRDKSKSERQELEVFSLVLEDLLIVI
jgi:hypothetical protein